MHPLYPFKTVQDALWLMYDYVGYEGVVFQLRCHEVLPSGLRVVEYQTGFTKAEKGPSLLNEAGEWANPLLAGKLVPYLWRLEVPNTDAEVLSALNSLEKFCFNVGVTDEGPRRLR